MSSPAIIPPPPAGYALDAQPSAGTIPPPPPGYALDSVKPFSATNKPDASVSAAPKPFTLPWLKSKFYTAADATADSLPAAGATIGGTIGATGGTLAEPGGGSLLGAVGGAGIGGMAGSAGKHLIRGILGFDKPGDTSTNDISTDIAKEGATQGGIEALTGGLARIAPWLKGTAVGQYERALAPTTKINKAIAQDIAPKLVQRGVHGSLDSIADQAGEQAANLRPQLNEAYDNLATHRAGLPQELSPVVNGAPASPTSAETAAKPPVLPGSGTKIVNDLEKLKGKYVVDGQPANPTAVDAISGVQDIVKQYGNDISPNSLRKLKQIFDDPVAAKGGYAGADLTTQYSVKAQKAAANSIRDIVHQASPDIASLDKEISFWLNVQKVAGASALRRTGQEGGLLKSLAPLASAAAGGGALAQLAGGGTAHTLEGATGAFLAAHAAAAMRSPAWRTASAVLKDRFADALASGNVGKVLALSARFGVAAPGVIQNPEQQSH